MTNGTKQHIDAARQVLVGVVPNPTSQIDQITNALIYKFMDDMDQAAIKHGGEASFFVKDLKKYAWTRLMDARVGNQEKMNLYGEALVKFSESKQLPPLFREIFKSAILPYRSPEVLGLFLKEIDYFDYSHPEELGNAYEYLLSIMSSQGDAGQFRTPRHIIDFMVAVVNPTIEDKVLDPACGTGGFLISAYKHILKQHDGKDLDGTSNKEKPLTPDQRKNLMTNFEGYDIDPSMVRIAQVNMYLHQFKNPKIYNYDTLTMEERWNEKFSVMLANPPFMSPKGGVSTHSKFSIQSNRSEVLFVDYIMNHLRPNGRAGIIVPEGIIFQSSASHKQLRKNLVEDGLNAVISLPSGVFQPYSGVKTSILLFDNELTKLKKEILFVKIDNDGFDLGATKRPINKNDLPEALDILNKWKKGKKVESSKVVYVSRKKITESGDYNLSGDRYRTATDYTDAIWPMVELGDICTFEYGKPLKEEDRKGSEYAVFGSNGIVGWHNEYLVKGPLVVIGRKGTAGAVTYSEKSGYPIDTAFYIQLIDDSKIDLKFLYFILSEVGLDRVNTQSGVPGLNRNDAYRIKIPLPPLEVQEQIVTELDGYQNVINGAKQTSNSWRPLINIDPEWDKVKIGDIATLMTGGTPLTSKREYYGGNIKWLVSGDINKGEIFDCEGRITELAIKESNARLLPVNSVLIALNGQGKTRGTVAILRTEATCNQSLVAIIPQKDKLIPEFLLYILKGKYQEIRDINGDNQRGGLNMPIIRSIEIALPPLEIQKKIVEKIEAEHIFIEGNKKLIEIYEQKTRDTLAKLWEK